MEAEATSEDASLAAFARLINVFSNCARECLPSEDTVAKATR